MHNNQIDILRDWEIEAKKNSPLFYAVGGLCGLLIVCVIIYYFWLFNETFSFEILLDTELQLLTVINVIFPLVALLLYMRKKNMGWSCMVFYSTVIVTYGFFSATFDFLNNVSFVEIVSEKTFVYFLFHFIILFLIFRPSLIRNFNFSQKILSLYNLDISNYIGVVFWFYCWSHIGRHSQVKEITPK